MILLLSLFGLVLIASLGLACIQEYRDFRHERCPSVTAEERGWKSKSWKPAQARTKFEVAGFSKRDQAFCEGLSAAYHLQLKIHKSKAFFIPAD
jgi:hypothetical protein